MNNLQDQNSNEIDISKLLSEIRNKKFFILAIGISFFLFSIFYSLFLPNKYSSFAIIQAAEDFGNESSIDQSLSSITGLVGIGLSGSNTQEYIIEVLKSHELFKEVLLNNPTFKQNLVAASSYSRSENKIFFKEDIFNEKTNEWTRSPPKGRTLIPSSQEVFQEFVLPNLTIMKRSRNSDLIEVTFTHLSPVFAQDFVDTLLNTLNQSSRKKDLLETELSLEYLEGRFKNTTQVTIRNTISNLLSSQLNKQMMANAKENYLVEVIEPPLISEIKSYPQRIIIIINFTMIGFFLGFLYVIAAFYTKSFYKKN
ncbi:MAG: hypothetical protein CL851_01250 [Crocinitomicaceae bacterium]|nr:hypothetical protein [Crocinitomicaceae bacterium]|tara:strand:+ start:38 stop:970 length:933 start_codon:yes stop_codon:yes gene_type:complete